MAQNDPGFEALRVYLEEAESAGTRFVSATLEDVELNERHLSIQVNPPGGADAAPPGVLVVFQDVTAARRLREELEVANRQLEAAHEELRSTNEELETTNEELQSTVEELETTNEQLRSTNEELETMNEQLQSTNDELRARTGALNDANAFLAAVLGSLRAGVVVLDRAMHVTVWNRRAEDLWGLRADEAAGRHLLDIDIGLATERLRPAVRDVLAGRSAREESQQPAVNRRGRAVDLRVVCTPLTSEHAGVVGAILVLEPAHSTVPAV